MPAMSQRRSVFALGCVAALGACGGPGRADLDPASLRFHARGQSAPLRATVRNSAGKVLPASGCEWSSSDERVARVEGRLRDATVTAVGPGTASILCRAGAASGATAVTVRLASRLEVAPARLELKLGDAPAPAAIEIRVLDTEGRPLLDRPAAVRCRDESVCRGDDRGQVWPVGAGETLATVEVDGAGATLSVRVVDARTSEGRPRPVKGNPMLDVEKAFAPPGR